jgi:hypothetical protein
VAGGILHDNTIATPRNHPTRILRRLQQELLKDELVVPSQTEVDRWTPLQDLLRGDVAGRAPESYARNGQKLPDADCPLQIRLKRSKGNRDHHQIGLMS